MAAHVQTNPNDRDVSPGQDSDSGNGTGLDGETSKPPGGAGMAALLGREPMTELAVPSPLRLLEAREAAYRALELAVERARDGGWPLPQIEALELEMRQAYRAWQEARDAYAKVRAH